MLRKKRHFTCQFHDMFLLQYNSDCIRKIQNVCMVLISHFGNKHLQESSKSSSLTFTSFQYIFLWCWKSSALLIALASADVSFRCFITWVAMLRSALDMILKYDHHDKKYFRNYRFYRLVTLNLNFSTSANVRTLILVKPTFLKWWKSPLFVNKK